MAMGDFVGAVDFNGDMMAGAEGAPASGFVTVSTAIATPGSGGSDYINVPSFGNSPSQQNFYDLIILLLNWHKNYGSWLGPGAHTPTPTPTPGIPSPEEIDGSDLCPN